MVGGDGLVEVLQVAGDALSQGACKSIPSVALPAINCDMGSCQGKLRIAMVKLRSFPLLGRMTNRAVLRKPGCKVIWISRVVKVILMAGIAICACACELVAGVTLHATHMQVGASEGEFG